jgi:energy-coupling factor transport system ATP-binding protein
MEVASKYAKRIIVLNEGRIVYDGDKKALFAMDDLLGRFNLNYPNTVKILRQMEAKFQVGLDVNQHSVQDAYAEIVKKFGENDEQ